MTVMALGQFSTMLTQLLPPNSPSSVQGMGTSLVKVRWEAWKEIRALPSTGVFWIHACKLAPSYRMLRGRLTRTTSNRPSSKTTRSEGMAFRPPTEMVLHTMP